MKCQVTVSQAKFHIAAFMNKKFIVVTFSFKQHFDVNILKYIYSKSVIRW
jgi:hypothetical protein